MDDGSGIGAGDSRAGMRSPAPTAPSDSRKSPRGAVPDHLRKKFDFARSRMADVDTGSPKVEGLKKTPEEFSPLHGAVAPRSKNDSVVNSVGSIGTAASGAKSPRVLESSENQTGRAWYENQGSNMTFEQAQAASRTEAPEVDAPDETVEALLSRYLNDVADKAITFHAKIDKVSSGDNDADAGPASRRESIQNMMNMSTWRQADTNAMEESHRWSTAPGVCSLCRKEDDMSKMIHPCSCGRSDFVHGECFLSLVADPKNMKCTVCKKAMTPLSRDGQRLDMAHPEKCKLM